MFNGWLTCGLLLKTTRHFFELHGLKEVFDNVWQRFSNSGPMFGHVWDWQLGSCCGMYWPLSGCFPWSSVDPQSHSPRYSLSGCYTATLACSWPDAVARLCRIVWGCLGLWIVMVRSDRDAADLSNSGAETVAVLTWGWVLTRGLWTISLLIKKFSSWLVRFFGGFTFERGRIPSWAHVWWLWGSSWMRCST